MLPWSVTARLSMPSFLTCATSSGIRLAPSSNEYSLWVWRWTKAMPTDCPVRQLLPDGVQRDTASLQQHQEMIEEIGRLGRETLGLLRIRRDDDLDRFLAHLLGDLGARHGRAAPRCTSPRAAPPPGCAIVAARRVSRCAAGILTRPSDPPSGATAVEKQVRAPVWQAGPVCSTRYRTASPSQSSRISRTACTWPEVSPLRQSAARDLL